MEAYKKPLRYDIHGQMIFDANDNLVADIRGWGYLTGTGGLNLPEDEALKIQDKFGEDLANAYNKAAEMESILKELVRVGAFHNSCIEIDVHEKPQTDGLEIIERINDVLGLKKAGGA